jgi:hypothetical protein
MPYAEPYHVDAALDPTPLSLVGIGIRKTNAGIGIPASVISVQYRSKKMTDCIILFRYRIGSGIVSLSQSGAGLTMPYSPAFR